MTWATVITLTALGALMITVGTINLKEAITDGYDVDMQMTPGMAGAWLVLGCWLLICAIAIWDRFL